MLTHSVFFGLNMNDEVIIAADWLWLSWLSSCFQDQRSTVRSQSSAKFISNICLLVYYQLYWKDEINKKMPGMAHFFKKKNCHRLGSGLVQLTEQLLLWPEFHSSKPVIGKIYIEHLFTTNCFKKMKITKKRLRMAI